MKREGSVAVGLLLGIGAILRFGLHVGEEAIHQLTPTLAHTIAADTAAEVRIGTSVLEPWVIRAGALGIDGQLLQVAEHDAALQAGRLDDLAAEIKAIAESHGLTIDATPGHLKEILHGAACDAMSDAMAGKKVDPTELLEKNGFLHVVGEPLESIVLATDTGSNMISSLAAGNSASLTARAARWSIECALAGRKP